jgi:hypothetical protein
MQSHLSLLNSSSLSLSLSLCFSLSICVSVPLGRYYLLDFSRTMPPVTPQRDILQGHLYRLFRKEFVQKYHGNV